MRNLGAFHDRGVVRIRDHRATRMLRVRVAHHANSDLSRFLPSMIQSALKILWRQCSEFACANIIVRHRGLRFMRRKLSSK